MVCEMDKTSICTEINSFEFWKEQCGLTAEAYDMSEKRLYESYYRFLNDHVNISGTALASECCSALFNTATKVPVSVETTLGCLHSLIYRNRYNCNIPVKDVAKLAFQMISDVVNVNKLNS